ncbi:MAG: hypothetical protein HOP22_06045 [Nitrospiraceae bacterium]|nr:hypothetical protein [Nitrospiraceae bacterium]
MKYRTRRELAAWSMVEVLAELDALKIEPESQTVYADDGPTINGVLTVGEVPAWLHQWQKEEIKEQGFSTLTLEQQTNRATTLERWRVQLYQHGVCAYVESLGMAKAQRELKARHAELSTWEGRNATRQEVEKKLMQAIENETEEDV